VVQPAQANFSGTNTMSLSYEMVLVQKLELEATEVNLKNNNQKENTPALVYKWNVSKSAHNM